MDLTDAFMTLRHYTDAGTSAREAVDWLDDYIYNEAGKLDALRAFVRAYDRYQCGAATNAQMKVARAALGPLLGETKEG